MSDDVAVCPYCRFENEKPSFVTKLKNSLPDVIAQMTLVAVTKKFHLKTGKALSGAFKATRLGEYLCGTKTMTCGNPTCAKEFPVNT